MSVAEHRILFVLLAGILLSVPVALVAFRWVFPRPARAAHPVIPAADAGPAGSFLDVPLPPPDPDEPGVPVRHWRVVDGVAALVLLVALTILMGPAVTSPEVADGFELSAETMLLQIAFQFSLLAILLFYVTTIRRFDVARIFGLNRLSLPRAIFTGFLWILAAGAVSMVTAAMAHPVVEWLTDSPDPRQQTIVDALERNVDPAVTALSILSIGIGAPLMEELVFRGFLFSIAKRFTDVTYAAVASSLFFAITHANLLTFVPLTVLGLSFAIAYERTRCLTVPVVMHAIFNLTQTFLLLYGPDPIAQPG